MINFQNNTAGTTTGYHRTAFITDSTNTFQWPTTIDEQFTPSSSSYLADVISGVGYILGAPGLRGSAGPIYGETTMGSADSSGTTLLFGATVTLAVGHLVAGASPTSTGWRRITLGGATTTFAVNAAFDTDLVSEQAVRMKTLGERLGELSSLTTTDKTSYTAAINEVNAAAGGTALPTMTGWATYTQAVTATTSAPTKGTTAVDQGYWRQIGDSLQVQFNYRQTSNGANGSGVYIFSLPTTTWAIDTAKITLLDALTATSRGVGVIGNGYTFASGTSFAMTAYAATTTGVVMALNANAFFDTSNWAIFANNTMTFGFTYTVPISGWTATA